MSHWVGGWGGSLLLNKYPFRERYHSHLGRSLVLTHLEDRIVGQRELKGKQPHFRVPQETPPYPLKLQGLDKCHLLQPYSP